VGSDNQCIAMGSVKEESASSAEPVKAEPADMKGDQGIKQPLLSKVPGKSSPHLTSMVPAGPKVDLPAFRLAAEGLVRLECAWSAPGSCMGDVSLEAVMT